MTRSERYAEVMRLRGLGFPNRRIANELGITESALRALINDPDGSKQRARRERYRGTCSECGKRTDGSSGYNPPTMCQRCRGRSRRIWTRESVIAAIQRWADEHGAPPRANDWMRVGPEGSHPAFSSVYRNSGSSEAPFASWNEAIRAAGFEPRRTGTYVRTEEHRQQNRARQLGRPGRKGPRMDLRTFDYEQARALREQGWKLREIGDHLGVKLSSVWRALHVSYEE